MKPFKMIAIVGLVGASLSLASAQGMRMGAMSQGMVMFSFSQGGVELRSDVSKELKLTDAQKTKLDDFQKKQIEEMMAGFAGGGPPSDEDMAKMMKKRQEAEDVALKEILDETQRTRLKELWIQRLGNSAIANADIQKELGLSDEQKEKVKALQAKQQEATRAIFEKVQSGEIERSEARPLREKNTKILNEEMGKVLNEEQAGKLKKMGGVAFKFDEQS